MTAELPAPDQPIRAAVPRRTSGPAGAPGRAAPCGAVRPGARAELARPAPETAEVTISVYPDGPLMIRGPFRLQTHAQQPIDPHRATVALCRCGLSRAKPFCDGTHALDPAGRRSDSVQQRSGPQHEEGRSECA